MLFATAHHDGGLLFRPLRRASYHRTQQRRDSAACCGGRAPAAKPAAATGGTGPAAVPEPLSVSSQQLSLPRRGVVLMGALAGVLGTRPAQASKLPEAVDRWWEDVGGGPADLTFPEDFLGLWDVQSVLVRVETPLGPEFVPDMNVVQRAQREDLQRRVDYRVSFMRNARGEVVPDRRYNTASLMHTYLGHPVETVEERIRWNPDDPNLLRMRLPGDIQVTTQVLRRSEEQPAPDRLDTSEYFQQLIDSPDRPRPKVKAWQCFTKYRWRPVAEAEAQQGPRIVATQVVSDYLTAYDDTGLMMRAGNQAVSVFTYRMAFFPAQQAQQQQ